MKVEAERYAVEEAIGYLNDINGQYKVDGWNDLSNSAGSLSRKLQEALARGNEAVDVREDLKAFGEQAKKAVDKRKLGRTGYKTPVFKCLEDHNRCCEHHNPLLCASLATICIGRQLIPFVGH